VRYATAAPANARLDDDLSRRLGTPAAVLLVSDLHLGEGRNASTGRFNARENFLLDAEFQRLLAAHAPAADGSSLLVLNGDSFDFLRIVKTPETERDVERWTAALADLGVVKDPRDLAVSRHERTYGFKTQDYKCIWKLLWIATGHPDFFAGLRGWVERGGRLVFVKGNHDLELHWPLVQRYLRRVIAGADPTRAGRIHFCETGFRIANLYVEHGHRFERTTAVRGEAELPGGKEINYAPGSLVNRYLINRLEGLEPFLDNMKPLSLMLRTIARKHPVRLLLVVPQSVPILARALRRFWFRELFAFAVFVAAFLLPIITGIAILLYFLVPSFAEWMNSLPVTLRKIMSVVGLSAPYVGGAIQDLWRKRRPSTAEDDYAAGVYEVLRGLAADGRYSRCYGIIGHTHVPDVQELTEVGASRAWYINSGTWTPNWSPARPDLAGRIVRSLVLFTFTDTEYRHECLEWTPQAGPDAPAVIFEPAAS